MKCFNCAQSKDIRDSNGFSASRNGFHSKFDLWNPLGVQLQRLIHGLQHRVFVGMKVSGKKETHKIIVSTTLKPFCSLVSFPVSRLGRPPQESPLEVVEEHLWQVVPVRNELSLLVQLLQLVLVVLIERLDRQELGRQIHNVIARDEDLSGGGGTCLLFICAAATAGNFIADVIYDVIMELQITTLHVAAILYKTDVASIWC